MIDLGMSTWQTRVSAAQLGGQTDKFVSAVGGWEHVLTN